MLNLSSSVVSGSRFSGSDVSVIQELATLAYTKKGAVAK